MTFDPSKLDDMEMLLLIAKGLIPLMERVVAGEKDPFPFPDALLCGFNQLILSCALRDVPKAQRPASIPEFVATWGIMPLSEWGVKLDVPADLFTPDDRLLDPNCDSRPTQLCHKLSRGEVMVAERTAFGIVAQVVC
jgi:hypothetical protein